MKSKILVVTYLVLSVCMQAQLNTDRIFDMGRNALYFEDYVLSVQYFNQVIKVKPFLSDPFYYRAISKYYLEDYSGAYTDCSAALGINPFLVDVYNLRGICLAKMSKPEMSIADYEKGLNYEPNNTDLLMNKGYSEIKLKKYQEALNQFDKVVALKPNNYANYLARGATLLELGDTLKADSDFTKAIALSPLVAGSYAYRGGLNYERGKYSLALVDLDKAVQLDPENTGFLINRGITRYQLDDLKGALSDYNRVLILDPGNVSARFNRGLLRSIVGDNNKAIEDFNYLLKLDADNDMALYNRANLYMKTGNYRGAAFDFTTLLMLHPKFFPALAARSEAKKNLGDDKGAQLDYNTAIVMQQKAQKEKDFALAHPELAKNDSITASESSSNQSVNGKKTRKSGDKNLEDYNKLVVLDNERAADQEKFTSLTRGKVQNRNVDINLEDIMVLSYQDTTQNNSIPFYSLELENLNKLKYDRLPPFIITNKEKAMNQASIDERFKLIHYLTTQIAKDTSNYIYYFNRAMNYCLVQDFVAAISDLNKVVNIKPDFALAYFCRANIRYRMVDYNQSQDFSPIGRGNNLNLEYDLTIKDYTQTLALAPSMYMAYYNRANVKCATKDFKGAVLDYSAAIKLNAEFSQAYFNRGLTLIFLGDQAKGSVDLSKAGELGIVNAYNVLKRHGINAGDE